MNAPETLRRFDEAVRALPPVHPTLASLIRQHRICATGSESGRAMLPALADEINVALMADCGLSRNEAEYLTGEVL